MSHFNQLTPPEAERLAILLEELGEAQHVIGKILRHGYESKHPEGEETNREMLERELGDVHCATISLCVNEDIREEVIHEWANIKDAKIHRYLHHQ